MERLNGFTKFRAIALQLMQASTFPSRLAVPFHCFYFLYKVRATSRFANIAKSIYCVNLPLLVLQATMSLFPSHCETKTIKKMELSLKAWELELMLDFATTEVEHYCTKEFSEKCKEIYKAVYRLPGETIIRISDNVTPPQDWMWSPMLEDWKEYQAELYSQVEESD